jgi:ribosome-associated protein
LPDSLFVALRDLRRLPSHGAQVRQRQYIGKLMRNIDPEPVLAKLAERKQRHDSRFGSFSRSSAGATGCCPSPPRAVELLQEARKRTADALVKLLEKAERERLEQRSPVGARELFAFLRQMLG